MFKKYRLQTPIDKTTKQSWPIIEKGMAYDFATKYKQLFLQAEFTV